MVGVLGLKGLQKEGRAIRGPSSNPREASSWRRTIVSWVGAFSKSWI